MSSRVSGIRRRHRCRPKRACVRCVASTPRKNSTEAIYALIMQTVRDRVLPEIIEQARGEGF